MFSPPSSAVNQPGTRLQIDISTVKSIHFNHSKSKSYNIFEVDEWSFLDERNTSLEQPQRKGVKKLTKSTRYSYRKPKQKQQQQQHQQHHQSQVKDINPTLFPIFTSYFRTPRVLRSSTSLSTLLPTPLSTPPSTSLSTSLSTLLSSPQSTPPSTSLSTSLSNSLSTPPYTPPSTTQPTTSSSSQEPPVTSYLDITGFDQEVVDFLNRCKPAKPFARMSRSFIQSDQDGEIVCLGSNNLEVGGKWDKESRGGESSDEEKLIDRVGRGLGSTLMKKKIAKKDAMEAMKMKRNRNRLTSNTSTPSLTTSTPHSHSRILHDIQPTEKRSTRTKSKQIIDDDDEYEEFGNDDALLAALGDDFRPPSTRACSKRRNEQTTYDYNDVYHHQTKTNASASGSGSGKSTEDLFSPLPTKRKSVKQNVSGKGDESNGTGKGDESTAAMEDDVKPLFLQNVQFDDYVVDLTKEEEDPIDGGIIDLDKEDEPAMDVEDGEDYFGGNNSFDYFGGDGMFETMDWESSVPGPSKSVLAPTTRGLGNGITTNENDMDYGDDDVPPLVMLCDLTPRKKKFFETHWQGGYNDKATDDGRQHMDNEDKRPPPPSTSRSRGGGRSGSKSAWRGRSGWRK